MNLPGRATGNWTWRFRASALGFNLVDRLLEITTLYGRDPELYLDKEDEAGGQSGKETVGAGGRTK
jgi:4-alpha-glucanotransferase